MELIRMLAGMTRLAENRDTKLVELKVGQVVRGVLLKMLSEQEGMVNIGGVPVRARLETPLRSGEATLLQVQPESGGAVIVLKPLTGSETPIADRSMADLLHWLGLKNSEQNRHMLQMMHQAGLPIDRETARAMARIAELRPEGVDAGRWLTAAAVAQGKQLPLTKETVQALHTVLFGKSPGETLQTLRQALTEWMQSGADRPAAEHARVYTAQRLLALLDRLVTETSDRLAQPPVGRTNPESGAALGVRAGFVSGGQTGHAGAANEETARTTGAWSQAGQETKEAGNRSDAVVRAPGETRPTAAQSAEQARTSQMQAQTMSARPAETAVVRDGLSAPARTDGHLAAQGQGTDNESVSPSAQRAAGSTGGSPVATETNPQAARAAVVAESAVQGAAAGPRQEPWLANLFRELGFDHEHRLLDRVLQPGEAVESMRETVKGLILTLQGDSQLPQALRDALQQTLQTITGQQLLLAADRQAPFSVVTMTVPLFKSEEGGEQSATVQIHARRNKGEALDAGNCRLLFDLNLARLGTLLMDVQVVDRMVSVRVHSDHPAAGMLLTGGKEEAEAALAEIGYRLLVLQHVPYSSEEGGGGLPGRRGGLAATTAAGLSPTDFGHKPYKGVDVRI